VSQGKDDVLVILGPTATGKTAVALEIAGRVRGEIISADSRAFFQELDLVTDKPNPEVRSKIPHHLIDWVSLDGNYDAMTFRQDVVRLLPEIQARGNTAIIAGGGTLYLGAILRGIFEGPAKDEALRAQLEDVPMESLVARLERVDPTAARRIHPNDRLRTVRALEVFELTGKRISTLQAEAKPLDICCTAIGLERERTEHRAAIRARLWEMLAHGLRDELARLQELGLQPEMQAYRTIGVPEGFALLRNELSEDEYVDIVSAQTWQLVRRQMAWFRRDDQVTWLDVTGKTAAELADAVLALWEPQGADA